MHQQQNDASNESYPRGRGYGHDYMRGGEVLGGYGYALRAEYEKALGEKSPEKKLGEVEPGQQA